MVESLAPDDSGRPWKSPEEWSKEEIHQLVIDHLGVDEVFARGYQLLVKLWSPPENDEYGLSRPDHDVRNQTIETTMGVVLRMGRDSFSDKGRFPSGPTVTYGEWAIFRGGQRQLQEINGEKIAFISDDRFLGPCDDPSKVVTGVKLEFDWAGQ